MARASAIRARFAQPRPDAAVAGPARRREAAVDMALHDLAGTAAAGAAATSCSTRSDSDTPQTSFTIGLDTPEIVVASEGGARPTYQILKVKMGSDDDRAVLDRGARHHATAPPRGRERGLDAGRRRWSGWSGWHRSGSSWWSSRCPRTSIEETRALRAAQPACPFYADETCTAAADIPAWPAPSTASTSS